MQFFYCYQNPNQQTHLGAWEWWKILLRLPVPPLARQSWYHERQAMERNSLRVPCSPLRPPCPAAAASCPADPQNTPYPAAACTLGHPSPPSPPSLPRHPWASTRLRHEMLRRTAIPARFHFSRFAESISTPMQTRGLVCCRKLIATLFFSLDKARKKCNLPFPVWPSFHICWKNFPYSSHLEFLQLRVLAADPWSPTVCSCRETSHQPRKSSTIRQRSPSSKTLRLSEDLSNLPYFFGHLLRSFWFCLHKPRN